MRKNQKFTILITGLIMVVSIFLVLIIYSGYNFKWTGFGEYTTTTTSKSIETDPITNQQKITETTTTETHPGKTLWDWFGILLGVLAGTLIASLNQFNEERRNKTELEIAEKARQTDRKIASDRVLEATLQTYLDKMGNLLMEKDLLKFKKDIGNPIRNVAQIQTITTLRLLDLNRKKILLQFLKDADLADGLFEKASLQEVDLSQVNISKFNFHNANLQKANLNESILSGSNFSSSNLTEADLNKTFMIRTDFTKASMTEVNLEGARLFYANLSRATLDRANLNHSILMDANFNYARLVEAQLRNSDLTGADLSGANLNGADLTNAELTLFPMENKPSLEGTIMPDGTKHE